MIRRDVTVYVHVGGYISGDQNLNKQFAQLSFSTHLTTMYCDVEDAIQDALYTVHVQYLLMTNTVHNAYTTCTKKETEAL